MTKPEKELKILDQKTSDNVYLHKDFHGALCCGIKYIDDTFGPEATVEYLQRVGETFYGPLTEELKKRGLVALEEHFKDIFTKEGGRFSITHDGDTLVLKVDECPAIAHMKKTNQFFTDRFCLTTVVVNETICSRAGFACICEYKKGEGRCIQKFWKNKE